MNVTNKDLVKFLFKKLDEWVESREHAERCIGRNEGCPCCLDILDKNEKGIFGSKKLRPMLKNAFLFSLEAKDEECLKAMRNLIHLVPIDLSYAGMIQWKEDQLDKHK